MSKNSAYVEGGGIRIDVSVTSTRIDWEDMKITNWMFNQGTPTSGDSTERRCAVIRVEYTPKRPDSRRRYMKRQRTIRRRDRRIKRAQAKGQRLDERLARSGRALNHAHFGDGAKERYRHARHKERQRMRDQLIDLADRCVGTSSGIIAELLLVPEVNRADVVELPDGSIHPIVDSGDNVQILDALYRSVPMAVPTVGANGLPGHQHRFSYFWQLAGE